MLFHPFHHFAGTFQHIPAVQFTPQFTCTFFQDKIHIHISSCYLQGTFMSIDQSPFSQLSNHLCRFFRLVGSYIRFSQSYIDFSKAHQNQVFKTFFPLSLITARIQIFCHCMMAGSTVDSRNSGVNIIKIRNIVDNDSPVFIAFYIFIRNNIQCPDK